MDEWLRQRSAQYGALLSEARILAEYAFGLSRTQLITADPSALPASKVEQFDSLLQRRSLGEPVAYLIAQREFYGRMFSVSPDVLIPRHDTETLIEAVLNLPLPALASVIDLGTGSGCIAITLALERPRWHVTATDISENALLVAKGNAQRLGAKVSFISSNWWQAMPAGAFDLIASNPPYIAANDEHLKKGDLRFEPTLALTDNFDGLSAYRQIIDGAKPFLNRSNQSMTTAGYLAFEHGYDQAQELAEILSQAGCQAITLYRDLSMQPRVTIAQILVAAG